MRLIKEVARRIGGIRTQYLVDQAAMDMRRITKSPFASWIVKEEKMKDFNLPMLDKYEGKGDPKFRFLHFK